MLDYSVLQCLDLNLNISGIYFFFILFYGLITFNCDPAAFFEEGFLHQAFCLHPLLSLPSSKLTYYYCNAFVVFADGDSTELTHGN